MAVTVRDVCERALRKIGVAQGEIGGDEMERATSALNDMLFAWKLAGVDTNHSQVTTSATFPLADEYIEGTVYTLAGRLSPDYVLPPQFDADDFFRKIQAAYLTITASTIDTALTRPPSRYWRTTRIR